MVIGNFMFLYIGIENGFVTNKNDINLYTENYQIDNICKELHASTYNKVNFENSNDFVFNNNEIPYISRYDYILKTYLIIFY